MNFEECHVNTTLLAGCWPWLSAFHSISPQTCYYNSWTACELFKKWWRWPRYWCCWKLCWEYAMYLLYSRPKAVKDPPAFGSYQASTCKASFQLPVSLSLVWPSLPVAAPGEENPRNNSRPGTDRSWYKMLWQPHSSMGRTQSPTWSAGSQKILSGLNCNPSHWELAL